MWVGRELVYHSSAVLHGRGQRSGSVGDQSSGEPADRTPQHVRVRRPQPTPTAR